MKPKKDAVELGFWTEEELTKENNKLVKELMNYELETLEEKFDFLAGRLTALEAVLNADDSTFIDKKYVAAIMGIKYFEGDSDKKEE